jgi:Cu/Ag efflux protein CusF
MKKAMLVTALIALPIGLSGCDKKPEVPKVEAPKAAATADAMPNMGVPVGSKTGKGSGTVTAIDTAKGTVTLDHGAIAELKWPAMEMGFSAKPEVLAGIKVGDKVDFEIDWDGKVGTVSRLNKAER